MGHLGLTPQSVHALGGFQVQGKELDAARAIVDDADRARRGRVLRDRARVRARRASPGWSPTRSTSRRSGSAPAATATARCSCSTTCSGSRTGSRPKFVRRYAELAADARPRPSPQFADDVRDGRVPVERGDVPRGRHVADALEPVRLGAERTRPSSAERPAPQRRRDAGAADRGRVGAAAVAVVAVAVLVVGIVRLTRRRRRRLAGMPRPGPRRRATPRSCARGRDAGARAVRGLTRDACRRRATRC